MLETHFRGGYMLNLSELMYSYSNKIGSNIKKLTNQQFTEIELQHYLGCMFFFFICV